LPVILFSTTFGRAHLSLGKAGVPVHVSIHIKGHLDPSWLSGTLPDQAALYGMLQKIDRLSLRLLSLERSETPPDES